MPRFLMFIEESKTTVRMKEFDAEDIEEATGMVEADDWREANGWEESDGSTKSEIRDDLCYEVKDEPYERQRGDDDGVEYADPRDYRDGRE